MSMRVWTEVQEVLWGELTPWHQVLETQHSVCEGFAGSEAGFRERTDRCLCAGWSNRNENIKNDRI